MPELPEVETVRRGLQPVMEGASIERVELNRPDLRFPFPERLAERLQGRQIVSLGRRAKYLLIELDDGLSIISHLGMSGSYRIELEGKAAELTDADAKLTAHDHMILHLTRPLNGGELQSARIIYNDPRRFGFILLAEAGELNSHPSLKTLGVEPTGNSLSGELLGQMFSGKKTPLKTALLDQRLIAGLGNIYVCEALWRSSLSPLLPAGEVGRHADLLAQSVRQVIADAIAAGGSSLRDYRQADGALGYFQHSFSVYDREGQPCMRCQSAITRIVQSGRSTFYCEQCQQ